MHTLPSESRIDRHLDAVRGVEPAIYVAQVEDDRSAR